MDPRDNPYSPGAGIRPPELAGREQDIETFEILRARARRGRSNQSIVMQGLCGVGKTVLLNELAAAARVDNWIVGKVEADLGSARTPFRNQVAQSLNAALRQAQGKSPKAGRLQAALRTFKSFSLKASPDGSLAVGIELDAQLGRGDTGALRADLTDLAIDLGDAALELDTGVALFIDEMQHLTKDELAAVCQACHEAGQQQKPLYVVGAGLPNLPGVLSEARSYSERLFEYRRVDRLSESAALRALVKPAEEQGAIWNDDAAALVLDASKGYPYFLQEFGKASWDEAQTSLISLTDASVAIDVGKARLDAGFFAARWERATPAERDYLAAMAADDDGPSSSGVIARRLNKEQSQLGPARSKLISKGLVYAPEHGLIAYTVPGMAEFVRRQPTA